MVRSSLQSVLRKQIVTPSILPAEARFFAANDAVSARALIDVEKDALQRIALNNRTAAPWSDLRQAYQQARHQIDFAHIEADVVLKSNGGYMAKGGHFSSSPKVEIVSGTEEVSVNGTIKAKVKLRGPDGNFYLKTNSKNGFASMTPDSWSLARAKGEMSRAYLGKSPFQDGQLKGSSGGVEFIFLPPKNNLSLWRGYPIFTP